MPIDVIANLVVKFFNFIVRPIWQSLFGSPEENNEDANNN